MRQRCAWIYLLFLLASCKHKEVPKAAFYYWKTVFRTDSAQSTLLKQAAANTVYLRFFDVVWDEQKQAALPNAVFRTDQDLKPLHITPVIFITNRVFQQLQGKETDSLARKCHSLIAALAGKAGIAYQSVQVDCDWTDGTKDKYFAFLRAFKTYSKKSLQATIRLHQVKYRERTGVPPVDKGVLMFYNMGKIRAGETASSIYNEQDAARYLSRLGTYPLALDVALPLFSWVIQSREGRVIQVYSKISRADLNNPSFFEETGGRYRARKSFFSKGIYIRENDIFKPEETDLDALKKAADQLSERLPPLNTRTIIYYELANINLPEFTTEALGKITDRF